MAQLTIANSALTVAVDTLGAQLSSIRTPSGAEHLWQGDHAVWGRRAPLLFPLIGRLKEGSYLLDGRPYAISTHGFARDMEFQVVEQSSASLSLELVHTADTLRAYPFPFSLKVTYRLEGRALCKLHQVTNLGQAPMLYELGGHDGFRVPVEPGSAMDQWSIRLPGLEEIRPYGMDPDFLLLPPERSWPLEDGRMALAPWTYGGLDTVVLDRPPQARAVLTDHLGRPRVELEFSDFPYLGVWTPKLDRDSGFVCIEPWSALPDCTFVGRELKDKRSIRILAPGQSECLRYTTTIYDYGKEN